MNGQDTVKWWDYKTMGKELYQVVSSKLNVECYSDFKRGDDSNGWEMWRLLNRAKDLICQDIGFHLEIGINRWPLSARPPSTCRTTPS